MTKIMLLGDTHGNTKFVTNVVIPEAVVNGVHWIYQVGDFGYWEHTEEGKIYLNAVNKACIEAGVEILFIAGNHDKTSLIFQMYNPIMDFYSVRPAIWFAPNGTQWDFEGTSFIALGGAYSVDKKQRLASERLEADARANVKYMGALDSYPRSYYANRELEFMKERYWFPEEEMTDQEVDQILARFAGTKIDVILAHDKPASSNPLFKLMPIPECMPNQQRLQKAVNTLQPKLFVHGHLHARYTDTIRCGDDNTYTQVEGLGADVPNFNQTESSWRAEDAWEFLNLGV